jgi:hypothetical protein
MHIALIAKAGTMDTGIGRYAFELERWLQAEGHQVSIVNPVVIFPRWLVNWIYRLLGWDLEAFFQNYPIWARYPKADLYHLTSQTLATLMLLRRPPGSVVVTVHDTIPWLVHSDSDLRSYHHRFEKWFDRLALRGIRRVDWVLTDSDFSADSLASLAIGDPPPVDTVYLGIG